MSSSRPSTVHWKLTAPEIELLSFVHADSLGGDLARNIRKWTASSDPVPFPAKFWLLKISKNAPNESKVIKDIPLTTAYLKKHLKEGESDGKHYLRVIWLIRETDVSARAASLDAYAEALKWMAENLGVSPLFFDLLFSQQSPIPVAKLSEWPCSTSFSSVNPEEIRVESLPGIYRSANSNCVWFKHDLSSHPEGKPSSLYVICSGKPEHRSAELFFERAERLHRAVPSKYGLLEFMAVDLLLNDTTGLAKNLNSSYRKLTQTLEALGNEQDIMPGKVNTEERLRMYVDMSKNYKSLGALGPLCETQVHSLTLMRDLAKAYMYAHASAPSAQRRSIAIHSMLDNMETAMHVIAGDVKSRLEFFSTLMNLHMGTLMQIDSHTSMTIADLSRKIAEEARKDSSDMRTIAIMTMFFLPSTLVAAVLSTPFFDPEKGGRNIGERFELFWIIAVPITAVVMTMWLFWKSETRQKSWERVKGSFKKRGHNVPMSMFPPSREGTIVRSDSGRV